MPNNRITEEICWAVVRMVNIGCTNQFISAVLAISEPSINRIVAIFHASGGTRVSVDLGDQIGQGRPRNLSYREIWFICDRIASNPDTYLDELQVELSEVCGVRVSKSTVWRTLKRCGFSMKKLDRHAIERSDALRIEYLYTISVFPINYLVFVDESSCDRRTTYRGKGWALEGQRAFRKAFFVRGRRYLILPSLSLAGIQSLRVIEGSFTAESFRDFIELTLAFMNPFPGPNSVIVMDNARIHHDQETLDLITQRGMRYVLLPPYSPDYNPIELAFSAIKSRIRRDGALMRMVLAHEGDNNNDIIAKFYEHVYATTADDARGWFRHCGYV